jgi:triacylglycerol lipase
LDESELAEWKHLGGSGLDPTCMWGNDGLVSVRSAQYGEWLGVVDGCDHWDTRGANGFSRAWVEGRSGWRQFFAARKWRNAEAEDAAVASLTSPGGRLLHVDGEQSGNPDSETNNTAVPALLDWIANRASSQAGISGLTPMHSTMSLAQSRPERFQTLRSRKPMFNLELFYIALARNLYDAGL